VARFQAPGVEVVTRGPVERNPGKQRDRVAADRDVQGASERRVGVRDWLADIAALATVFYTLAALALWWVTKRSLKVSQQALEASQRAWVVVKSVKCVSGPWPPMDGVTVSLANSGRSPAQCRLLQKCLLKPSNERLDVFKELSVKPVTSNFMIAPGGAVDITIPKLDKSDFGIVCLTPENLKSELLNFEAGVLSSDLDNSRVCPYLFDIDKADVGRPFSEFQLTVSTQEDTLKLVGTINKAMLAPLDDARLKSTFGKWWPDLEKELKAVRGDSKPAKRRRPEEILDEVLDIVRKLDLRLLYGTSGGGGGGVVQISGVSARGSAGTLTEEPKAKEPKKE